ncbi:MAG: hypothetical protein JWP89_4210 [Schlesneria sp.]|nr:hypothetical protein [Schlesneria sp.]
MANFRAERLFIRIAGELDFDPNEGINAEEFAFAMVCDGGAYDRPSLQDYTFAPYDSPRWFRASKGLATIRAVIAEEEAKLTSATPEQRTHIENKIEVLRVVEDKLDSIDLKDYKFHFLARDLG